MKAMKRIIAILLTVFMLFGTLSVIGTAADDAAENSIPQEVSNQLDEQTVSADEDAETPPTDYGTATDPETGEEHPILPSVEDQIPDDLDELVAVGEANERTEAESAEETPPAQTETAAPNLEDFAAEYDTSEVSDVDLSSCRILVSAAEDDIITEDAVLAELDGMYLMQFEDEDTAALAYMYYNDKAD